MRSNNIPGHQANAVMAGREDTHKPFLAQIRHLYTRLHGWRNNQGDDTKAAACFHVRQERLSEQQAALAALTQSEVFHGEDLEKTFHLLTQTTARLMTLPGLFPGAHDQRGHRCGRHLCRPPYLRVLKHLSQAARHYRDVGYPDPLA
jgi:hypothetical protein